MVRTRFVGWSSVGWLLGLAVHGVACRAAPTLPTVVAVSPVRADEPSLDLSEVPAPEALALQVRAAAPHRAAERLSLLSGYPPPLRAIEALYASCGGVEAALDQAAAMDLLYVTVGDGRYERVLVGTAGSVDEVERALAADYRFEPLPNGARRIVHRPANADAGASDAAETAEPAHHWAIAPTAREGVSRVLCGESRAAIDLMLPYAARTLPRHEGAPEAILLEATGEWLGLQRSAEDRARSEAMVAQTERDLARSPAPALADPAAREAVLRVVRDVAQSGAMLTRADGRLTASVAFVEGRAEVRGSYALPSLEGALLRGLVGAAGARGPVPPELTARLLPDGALYAGGTLDARPLRPALGLLVDAATALARATPTLTPADRAALQAALQLTDLLDQAAYGLSAGFDAQGVPWIVGTVRPTTTPPVRYAAALGALFAVTRRPPVARLLGDARQVFDESRPAPSTLRVLGTRGLPAGSFGMVVPRRAGTAGAAPQLLQVLVVPDGANLHVLAGADARRLFQRARATATPGIDPAGLAVGTDAAGAALLVPAGLANLFQPTPSMRGQMLTAGLARTPDHGRTPVAFRAGATLEGQGARVALTVDLPAAVFRTFFATLTVGRPPSPGP